MELSMKYMPRPRQITWFSWDLLSKINQSEFCSRWRPQKWKNSGLCSRRSLVPSPQSPIFLPCPCSPSPSPSPFSPATQATSFTFLVRFPIDSQFTGPAAAFVATDTDYCMKQQSLPHLIVRTQNMQSPTPTYLKFIPMHTSYNMTIWLDSYMAVANSTYPEFFQIDKMGDILDSFYSVWC